MMDSFKIRHYTEWDQYLNKRAFLFILTTQLIQLGAAWISSIYNLGWTSAAAITYTLLIVYISYAIVSKNMVIRHLIVFALVAGIVELWADNYSVSATSTLVYTNGPSIWSSPAYMPFAWVMIFTQLGFYSKMIVKWKGIWWAIIALAIFGGIYIPIYEHLAANAHWWYYRYSRMFYSAPYFVIMAEAMMCISVPPLVNLAIRKGYFWTVFFAIIQGIIIYFCGWLAYELIP